MTVTVAVHLDARAVSQLVGDGLSLNSGWSEVFVTGTSWPGIELRGTFSTPQAAHVAVGELLVQSTTSNRNES